MGGITYDAPPTIARFGRSDAFGRILAGPVGSGKTTGCIIEVLRRSLAQTAGEDGLRHTRWAVVRQTLKQLKDTVLKDCNEWLGGVGKWMVSESTFHLNFADVRSELILIPLEDAEDQARLLSMQLTGAWLSEAIEMDISVLAPLSGRIGRFPSASYGAPTWMGMIADTNMPPIGSPWHKFMENPPNEWQIFRQPSGMSPEAENLPHLQQTEETKKLAFDDPIRIAQGRKYYERLVNAWGRDSDWCRRYVYAEYGEDPSGTAVFRDSFKHSFHVVPETFLVPGFPVIIGQDFGRDPWSLIGQVDHLGRLVIHEEVPAEDVGLELHVQRSLKPRLMGEKYLGYRIAAVGDPAGKAKSTVTEESNIEAMKRMGIPCFPASTNDLDPRIRAVEALLLRQTAGGPQLVINGPNCPNLVLGLSGAYRFSKSKQGIRKPVPDKGPYSHVADCLQYLALTAHGGMVDYIASRLSPRKTHKRPAPSSKGWS